MQYIHIQSLLPAEAEVPESHGHGHGHVQLSLSQDVSNLRGLTLGMHTAKGPNPLGLLCHTQISLTLRSSTDEYNC